MCTPGFAQEQNTEDCQSFLIAQNTNYSLNRRLKAIDNEIAKDNEAIKKIKKSHLTAAQKKIKIKRIKKSIEYKEKQKQRLKKRYNT